MRFATLSLLIGFAGVLRGKLKTLLELKLFASRISS